jgi:predicted DNA-binding protein
VGKTTSGKQNVTIRLDRETIEKAKAVAARRGTSISDLLAQRIEVLAGEAEGYELAHRQAIALLDQGFHLGGATRAGRDELHERWDDR